MHHTFRFYGSHQHGVLKAYMMLARLTRVPIIGRLVRFIGNSYGKRFHHGYVLSVQEAEQIIDAAESVAIGTCACRHVFHNCDAPETSEIVVGIGAEIFPEVRSGEFKLASKEDAKKILHECHQLKFIHTIQKCLNDFYAICNCCPCCCVPLILRRDYGIGSALVREKDIVAAVTSGLV
jgi:hypothetical protein